MRFVLLFSKLWSGADEADDDGEESSSYSGVVAIGDCVELSLMLRCCDAFSSFICALCGLSSFLRSLVDFFGGLA